MVLCVVTLSLTQLRAGPSGGPVRSPIPVAISTDTGPSTSVRTAESARIVRAISGAFALRVRVVAGRLEPDCVTVFPVFRQPSAGPHGNCPLNGRSVVVPKAPNYSSVFPAAVVAVALVRARCSPTARRGEA